MILRNDFKRHDDWYTMTDGPLTDFEIYYTEHGLVQVSNDVHRSILAELRDSDRSLTELAKALNKAQSTLSVHLSRMVEQGLISIYDDPEDSRRKVYSLCSVRFAYSKEPEDASMDAIIRSISSIVSDPVKTRDAMVRFIFLGMDGIGLSIEPMAHIIGWLHAMALGGSLTGGTIEDTVANARDYYSKMGLGEINVFSLKPLTIVLRDDMMMTEGSARSFGGYAVGFMSKILEDATGKAYEAESKEVFGEGFNNYKFVLAPSEKRSELGLEREKGAVPQDIAAFELHFYPVFCRPSVPVAGCGGFRPAYYEAADEYRVSVDHLRPEERRYRAPAAFHQHAFDADLLGERVHHRFQIYGLLPCANGLLAVPFPVATFQCDHDRRGSLIEDEGVVGRLPVRIEDYADGVRVVGAVLEREMGVVGQNGAHPYENRVVFLPEVLYAGLVLVRGYPDLGAVLAGDLAVGGHCAVNVDERPHCYRTELR